jgi:membrane associated rhomboid family serine protease
MVSERQRFGVVVPIAAINILVFLFLHLAPLDWAEAVWPHLAVSPGSVGSGRVWTLVTSGFTHLTVMHLLFNMMAFVSFGRMIEQVIGPMRLAGVYLAGVLAGSLAHVALGLLTGSAAPAIGASGATMAISVLFACIYPKLTVTVVVIPMPAWLSVVLFIALDLFGVVGNSDAVDSVLTGGTARIAHAAHLGGAAVGLGYYFGYLRSRLVRG